MTPGNGQPLTGGPGRLPLPSTRPQWQGVLGHWQWVTFPGCVPAALALMEAGEREGGKGDSTTEVVAPSGAPILTGGGYAALCTQGRLSRGSPQPRRVPKPLRTLRYGGGPQGGFMGVVSFGVEGDGGWLRWPRIAAGSAGSRYGDSVTVRGGGRGQQCPGGGSRDPAACCLHRLPAPLRRVSPSGGAGGRQGLRWRWGGREA